MAEELKITKNYIETQFQNYHNHLKGLINTELDKKQNNLTADNNFFIIQGNELKLNTEVSDNSSGFFYWDGQFRFFQTNEKTERFVPDDTYYKENSLINKTPVSKSELYFYGGSNRINTVGEITSGSWNSEGVVIKNNKLTINDIVANSISNGNTSITLTEETLTINGETIVNNRTEFKSDVNIKGNVNIGTDENQSTNVINGYTVIRNLTVGSSNVENLTINGEIFSVANEYSTPDDFNAWLE